MNKKEQLKTVYRSGYNCYMAAGCDKNKIEDRFFLNSVQSEAYREQIEHPLKEFKEVIKAVYNLQAIATFSKTYDEWMKIYQDSLSIYNKYPCKVVKLLLTGMYIDLYQQAEKEYQIKG